MYNRIQLTKILLNKYFIICWKWIILLIVKEQVESAYKLNIKYSYNCVCQKKFTVGVVQVPYEILFN